MHRRLPRGSCALPVVLAFLLALPAARVGADRVSLEFVEAPIAEMLVATGRATGRSIVPDDTVTGTATYYLSAVDANMALALLAERFGLFVETNNGIHTVSAVRVMTDREGILSVTAPRVRIPALLERISRTTGVPVLYDGPPLAEISYHAAATALPTVLAHIAAHLPGHRLEELEGAYRFVPSTDVITAAPPVRLVTRDGDRYGVSIGRAGLREILDALFAAAELDYQLLKRSPVSVDSIHITLRSFDDLLRLILERADAVFTVVAGIYYISDAPPQTALARTIVTEPVQLHHRSAGALLELLPAEQTADVAIRVDRSSHLLTLTGNADAVNRVRRLIGRLDRIPDGYAHHRLDLNLPAAEVLAVLPRHLSGLGIAAIPGAQAITVYANADQLEAVESFLRTVDVPHESTLVELSHIGVDRLLANLPASVPRSSIVPTGDLRRFFYRGSPAALEAFRRDLAQIDVPSPQIMYHLLVIRYQEGSSFEFGLDLHGAPSGPNDMQAIIGSIGRLLSLDFDIIAAFGYQFAARLSAGLSDSSAAIVADTSLSALSGETVSFRNTTTYRYRDTAIDPDTGAQRPTGVVREIASGLLIDITGVVAGDTVTMDVAATVSRRGADISGSGNPPPTSEKIVRTRVRAASGEPVILGGLRLRESEGTVDQPALVGKIPLIGKLFQKQRRHTDTGEFAIYIIPRVDNGFATREDSQARLLRIYAAVYEPDGADR